MSGVKEEEEEEEEEEKEEDREKDRSGSVKQRCPSHKK